MTEFNQPNHLKFLVGANVYIMDKPPGHSDVIFVPCKVSRHTKTTIVVEVIKPGTRSIQERRFRADDLDEVGSYSEARQSYSYYIPRLVTREASVIPRLHLKVRKINLCLTPDCVLLRLKHSFTKCPEGGMVEALEKEIAFFKQMQADRHEILKELDRVEQTPT